MAKGFGIVGLVIAIIAIFVPLVAIYVMWLGLIVATVGALVGDRIFTVITWVVTVANIVFFSPITLALLIGTRGGGGKRRRQRHPLDHHHRALHRADRRDDLERDRQGDARQAPRHKRAELLRRNAAGSARASS